MSVRALSPRVLIGSAAVILLITMGIRQSLGLFVEPIVLGTGLGIVSVSFALAIGQFMWGVAQPIFGGLADEYGAYRVLILGALVLAAGCLLAPFAHSEPGLVGTLGVLLATGAAAGSFAILIGSTAQYLPANRRSLAAGIINAGGSLGQFLFAPPVQYLIGRSGWRSAMFTLGAVSLLTIPLAWLFRDNDRATLGARGAAGAGAADLTMGSQLRVALHDRSYWCLHAGFFTCGFHIAFLVTHLPGDLRLCGLPASVAAGSLAIIGLSNVAGSLTAGWLGGRYRMKYVLALMYASRALIVAVYLVMPKTALNVYLAAAAFGLTWLATVPPTAGLVGKLFGPRYLTTLFGLTLLSHQVGGFLGAWLGGLAMARLGSYEWVWYADMALALAAALLNLPIREAPPLRTLPQPA
ncbi:MAG TPA: MFS transporter [Steroidobacteraceae bacterium]|nr:MFS transporter [Steroidobacteraceae bacterium]